MGPGPARQTSPARPGTLPAYLTEAADLIRARVAELADRATREHPAWMAALGQPPADPARRAEWQRHVAIVAAYRDQHRIRTDGPRQVLGPCPAAGNGDHQPYRHATESVLAARRSAGLDVVPGGHEANEPTRRTATDRYRSRPESGSTAPIRPAQTPTHRARPTAPSVPLQQPPPIPYQSGPVPGR